MGYACYSSSSALASGDLVLGDPDQFHLMYDASAASLTIGKPTEEHIVIDGGGIKIKNNTTAYLTLDGGNAMFTGQISAYGNFSAASNAIVFDSSGAKFDVSLSQHALQFMDGTTKLGQIEGFSDLDRHLHIWTAYSVKGSDMTLE